MTREYWVKHNWPYLGDGWPGKKGSATLGPENYGTKDRPVEFSAGGLSWLIYDGEEKRKDLDDTSTMEHIVHLVGEDNPSTFYVGPDTWLGNRCQGATCLYIQLNPIRPNRKIKLRIIGHGNVHLFYTSRHYSKKETDAFLGNIEDAVIRMPLIQYLDEFELRDVTIDANFKGQGYAAQDGSDTKGYRIHGVQVRAQKGVIENVRIQNCGSNPSTVEGVVLNECFPLNVYALNPDPGAWRITNVEVSKFHAVTNSKGQTGYATMIAPCMFTDKPEKTPVRFFPDGEEDAYEEIKCVVENCTVNGTRGINGLGSSGTTAQDGAYASSGILFRNNLVRGCSIGTNNDTSGIWYQYYEDNIFEDVSVMAQLGTPTGGTINSKPDATQPTFHRNFVFRRNIARLRRHDLQLGSDHKDRIKACGLMVRNSAAGIIWDDNTIVACNPEEFCNWSEDPRESYYREVCLSGDDHYYPEYYGQAGPANICVDPWMRNSALTRKVEV